MSDVLFVLGMHRSGTSTVAGVLSKIGAATPRTLMPSSPDNPRGYFESIPVMHFNDEILASAGSSWKDWRAFNPDWAASPVGLDFRRRAREVLKEEFGEAPLWVFKDPRMCRTAPFWFDVLGDIGARPHVVLPFRSPLDIARSLQPIHGLSITHGLLLWLRHVLDAERDSRSLRRSIFSWRDFRADWRSVCERAGEQLEMRWPRLSDRAGAEVERFLSRKFVHYETDDQALSRHADVNAWTLRSYEALRELARNPHSNSAMAELDNVRQLFDQASAVFGRLLAEQDLQLEDARATQTAANAERDGAEASRQEALAEKAVALAQLMARAEAAEREKEDLARQREQALAERDELSRTLAAREASHRQELEDRAAAFADQFGLREAAEQALGQAQAERETLQATLAAREASHRQELEDRAAAFADQSGLREAAEQALGQAQARQERLQADLQACALALETETREREHLDQQLQASFAERDALEGANVELLVSLTQERQKTDERASAAAQLRGRAETAEQVLAQERERLTRDLRQANEQAAEQARRWAKAQRTQETQTKAQHAQLIDAEAAAASLKRATRAANVVERFASLETRRRRTAKRLLASGLFDAEYYRAHYGAALAKAGRGESALAAALHYVEEGFCAGCRPNPLFDSRWYLERYEDVRRDGVNPLLHYHLNGWKEGRDPGPEFQTAYYLETNLDIRAACTDPLAHYLNHGRHEGRRPVSR